jgi:hypothetical protein
MLEADKEILELLLITWLGLQISVPLFTWSINLNIALNYHELPKYQQARSSRCIQWNTSENRGWQTELKWISRLGSYPWIPGTAAPPVPPASSWGSRKGLFLARKHDQRGLRCVAERLIWKTRKLFAPWGTGRRIWRFLRNKDIWGIRGSRISWSDTSKTSNLGS